MSFAIRLATDMVAVDAGSTAPISVEIANRDDAEDSFEIFVEGLDPSWTAVPVPSFQIDSHDIHTEKLFLKPPRESESLAGTYPFVIRVRSLNTGEDRAAQAVLDIRPYHHLSLDLSPKKGVVKPFSKESTFEVTVMNLGNCEHNLQLYATDTDDACAFEFETEKVTVGPGQQKTVGLRASGTRRPLLANSRLFGFVVSARSTSVPTVMSSVQGQLEQRAFASPSAIIMFFMLALLIGFWWRMMPQKPRLEAFVLDRKEAVVGDSVRLDWRASNAKSVVIAVDGALLKESVDSTGSYNFQPKEARTYTLEAYATDGANRSDVLSRILVVGEPPPTPEPKILEFKITPANAVKGDKLLVHYRLNNAVTKATLSPLGRDLPVALNDLEIEASRVGELSFTITAENGRGQTATMSRKVTVVAGSKAKVVLFRADPKMLVPPDNRVRLTWQLTDAVKVEISDGGPPMNVDAKQGEMELVVEKSTTFTLTAYDADGQTVQREVKVSVKPPAPEEPPNVNPDGSPGEPK